MGLRLMWTVRGDRLPVAEGTNGHLEQIIIQRAAGKKLFARNAVYYFYE